MYRKTHVLRAVMRTILLSTVAFLAEPVQASDFVNVGPAPVQGQGGNAYDTYSGAVTDIVTDPADNNTYYVGTANGGVWVTHDGGTTWTPLTDKQISLSIDSLTSDPTDATGKTLLAGTGLISNGFVATDGSLALQSRGGNRAGLLYSKDGGATWAQLGGTTLSGQSVDGVAVRGNTILAGTYERAAPREYIGGLYRSTDGGTTFTLASGSGGLPDGPVSSVVGDPNNPNELYVAVTAHNPAGINSTAVYVSSDTGATWTKVFGQTNSGGVINDTDRTTIRLASGPGGALAVGIVDVATGKVGGLFLSKNSGTSWQSLPVPANLNGGGQGNINFTLAIDPNNTNYVYIAGDSTQTAPFQLTTYRIDAGTNTATSIFGANTGDNSAVHPDGRSMAFDSSGNLIVSSDGGIYERTQPQSSAGVWHSLTGNLSAIETYQAAYGANSHLVAMAAQDNSADLQSANGSIKYNEIYGGDGTIATVNDKTLAGDSVFYLSVQNLVNSSVRVTVDSTGKTIATDYINFNIDPNTNKAFAVPFVLNKIDPSLIAIGGDYVYLTQDTLTGAQAPNTANLTYNLTKLGGDGSGASAVAYGTKDNTNALIAGIGGGLWMSTSTAGGISVLPAYTGLLPTALAFDLRTQQRFFSADGTDLWGTTDQGASFQQLTANLPTGLIRPTALEFIDNNGVDALVVGGLDNAANVQSPVAVADSSAAGVLSNWRFFGSSLPNVQISQLVYNPLVDVLTVSTFGRGVWLLYDVTSNFPQATVLQFGLADNDSTPDASLLTGNRPLVKYGTGTLLITGAGAYTGGTTINAGTLQLGNGGTSGSILDDVVDNGSFVIDRSDTYTFGGGISGAGTFTQTGTGTTVLTGNNTYSGVTTIAAGTLQLGNGGTSGSLTGSIVDNGQAVIDRSDNFTFNNSISGTGGFTQAGSGILTLTGTDTYTGATQVIAGTLSVNGSIATSSGVVVANGAILAGTGTVPKTTVGSGGTIAPGNSIGTLNVNGNLMLSAGSIYDAEFSPTASDKLQVGGTAAVAGELLLVPGAGTYSEGAVYTLINSTGALTGAFSNIVLNGTFGKFVPSVSYDANDIFVTLKRLTQLAWSANPGSSDWNTAANWTNNTVPTATDTALFNATAVSSIGIQNAGTQVGALQFNAGAPAYTFNITGMAAGASSLAIGGAGIVDQSSNAPTFIVSGVTGNTGTLEFDNGASAGDAKITASNFGTVKFAGTSDASQAALTAGVGGTIDISGLAGTGIGAGSIAGAGSFVLGSKTLTVGGLNTSTEVRGVISGTGGALIKTGTGTLTLSGENTYTGGTTINAGTLQLGNGGASGSIAGDVVDNGLFSIDRSGTYIFGGAISGTGAFTQTGTGTTILTGISTYTGATNVASGVLQIDGQLKNTNVAVQLGATLQGSGTVKSLGVANGGVVSPGSGTGSVGTLTSLGDVSFSPASTLALDVNGSLSDALNIGGALNAAGQITVNYLSTPHLGDSAVFATAAAVNGSFAPVTDNIPGVLYPSVGTVTVNNRPELVLTIQAGSFVDQLTSPSPDELAIAKGLDAARTDHYNDLKGLYDQLDPLSDGTLGSSLNSLVPNAARALPGLSEMQIDVFLSDIWNHLTGFTADESSDMAFNVDRNGLMLAQQSAMAMPGSQAMRELGPISGVSSAAPADVSPAQSVGSVFGSNVGGFLSGASLNGSVAAAPGGERAHVSGYLVSGGVDIRLSPRLIVGAAIAYSDVVAKLFATPSRDKAKTFQGVAYGRYTTQDNWFVEGFAGAGAQSYTTDRIVSPGGVSYDLHGKTHGSSPTIGATGGYLVQDADFTIAPNAGLQWIGNSVDGYKETGGPAALAYHSVSRDSFTGRAGFDANWRYTLWNTAVTPTLDFHVVHDFDNGSGNLTAAFAAAPTTLMTFSPTHRSSTWIEYGLGVQAAIGDDVLFSVRYGSTAARNDIAHQSWTGQMTVKF